MNVAVVVEEIPAETGGVVTFSRTVIDALRGRTDSRHRFHYFAAGASADPGVEVIPPPQVPPPPGPRRLARNVANVFRGVRNSIAPSTSRFASSLEEKDIDLVWFAARHAEPCSLPFIFTVLDVEHLRQPWFPEVSGNGSWDGRHSFFSHFIGRATRVIVPNEAEREQVERTFPIGSERIMTLPHPTPQWALEAAEGESGGRETLDRLEIEGRYLFYPAQFWPHKNHLTAIEALVELGRDGEPFDLVLVGADTKERLGQLDYVKQLARDLGVAERVHFPGFVETAELAALYRNAFALSYLSLFGPENLPPLEAMALGCPVIAADVPGAADQLGDAAVLVDATDPSAVAAAVRGLEEEGARSRLIDAGRERAGAWSADDYVGAVIEFLDSFEHTRKMWR